MSLESVAIKDKRLEQTTITVPTKELRAREPAVSRSWAPAGILIPASATWACSELRNVTFALASTLLKLLKMSSDPELLLKCGITYWKLPVVCVETGMAVASIATVATKLQDRKSVV